MRYGQTAIFMLALAAAAAAQSARVKASPTPSPDPNLRPSVIFLPTAKQPDAPGRPRVTPTPTPTPKPEEDVVRVDSTLVPIPVSVLDGQGRPITTLRLEDFELKIDGQPAEISEMTRTETPIRLAMLFDNSSSVTVARDFEKEAAIRFFRRVVRPDRDMAALFSVAENTRLEQPLTRDVSLLVRAIEAFPIPEGPTALLDGIIEVAEFLRFAEGRRVVVIVSDGEDTYSQLNTTLENVLFKLQITNCQVFVVRTKDFENYKRTGRREGNANTRTLAAERRMLELAAQTGGAVYSPIDEDEMNEAFRQISAELSQQYVLSHYPDDRLDKPGEFRTISVTAKGKPGMSVRSRKGYYVPKK